MTNLPRGMNSSADWIVPAAQEEPRINVLLRAAAQIVARKEKAGTARASIAGGVAPGPAIERARPPVAPKGRMNDPRMAVERVADPSRKPDPVAPDVPPPARD